MVIFCEECGERYIIEDEDMKGSALIFICRVCSDIIHIPAKSAEGQSKQNKQPESPVENT